MRRSFLRVENEKECSGGEFRVKNDNESSEGNKAKRSAKQLRSNVINALACVSCVQGNVVEEEKKRS